MYTASKVILKNERVEAVTETALTYQLLSQYTTFVAVSDDVRVEPGSEYVSMQVPVEMPEGVSYEGVFGSPPGGAVLKQIAYSVERTPAEAPDFLLQRRSLKQKKSALPSPKLAAPISQQLEVISVTGLDKTGIADLTQHLQQLNFPSGFTGEIVFEFTVNNSRIAAIMLDEEASTQKDAVVVEKIKRSLLLWRVPPSTTGKIVLILRIHT
ncbi:MAG: after-VIT domain-containing protein [Nostoc sp. CmiVER01]|uniref:after-VIT domain-containing protein n=1 Tax=Nostoc sp. CmiVER01 TaxID=3075384 RepID=UPI002AD6BBE9|nr:after-VIT domain-containing protein [Nostoc sp. CmiVER01]